jgi:hypothetical protein
MKQNVTLKMEAELFFEKFRKKRFVLHGVINQESYIHNFLKFLLMYWPMFVSIFAFCAFNRTLGLAFPANQSSLTLLYSTDR